MNIMKPRRSVAQIVKGLSTTLTDLRSHADTMEAHADDLNSRIEGLSRKRLEAIDERTRANRIADNIQNILEA